MAANYSKESSVALMSRLDDLQKSFASFNLIFNFRLTSILAMFTKSKRLLLLLLEGIVLATVAML